MDRKQKLRSGQLVSRRRFIETVGIGTTVTVAGCSGDGGTVGDTDDDGVTIQVTIEDQIAGESDDAQARREEYLNTLYDVGLPDSVEVDFQPVPQNENMQNQYQTWLSSGREQPDVLETNYAWGSSFVKQGLFQNINEIISNETIQRVNEGMPAQFVDPMRGEDGDLYGVPQYVDIPCVMYRKDMVEEAGFDPEGENWAEEPISWQRMAEVAAETAEQAGVDYGFTFPSGNYAQHLACCVFAEFMHSMGGTYFGGLDNYFGGVGDRPVTTDEQPVVDAIRLGMSFIYGPDNEHALDDIPQITTTDVMGWNVDPSRVPFADGNAVFHRNWPYAFDLNINDAGLEPGNQLAAMPIPYGVTEDEAMYEGTGGTTPALGGWHMCVNPNTQNPKASGQFIDAMLHPDAQLKLFELTGWQPPTSELFFSDQAANVEPLGFAMNTLGVCSRNAISRPVTAAWAEENKFIYEEVTSAWSQEKDPATAGSDMRNSLMEFEDQFRN